MKCRPVVGFGTLPAQQMPKLGIDAISSYVDFPTIASRRTKGSGKPQEDGGWDSYLESMATWALATAQTSYYLVFAAMIALSQIDCNPDPLISRIRFLIFHCSLTLKPHGSQPSVWVVAYHPRRAGHLLW
jgi:hypothetical protein